MSSSQPADVPLQPPFVGDWEPDTRYARYEAQLHYANICAKPISLTYGSNVGGTYVRTWTAFLKWAYGDRWEKFADVAPTPSEVKTLQQLTASLGLVERALNKENLRLTEEDLVQLWLGKQRGQKRYEISKTLFAKAIDHYLGVVASPITIELDTVDDYYYYLVDYPTNERLLDLLRAKFERRIFAERNGLSRLRMCRLATFPGTETGSAAAIAKRMNPLGAPPLNA